MSFPNLVLIDDGELHSRAIGVPSNGNNEFEHGIDPRDLRGNEDWLEFYVYPRGSTITAAAYVSLSADLTKVTVNFNQAGVDEALVEAKLVHSSVR